MSLSLTNFHDVVDINRNLLNAVDKIDKLYVGSYEKEYQALQEQFQHGDFKLPEDGDYSYLFAYWPDKAFNPLKKDYLKPKNMRGMFFGSTIKNLADQCTLDLSECTDVTNAFARCYNLTNISFDSASSIIGGENFVLSFQDCPLDSSTRQSIRESLEWKSGGGKGGTIYFKAPSADLDGTIEENWRGCWTIIYTSAPETIVYPCTSLESELDNLELANFDNNKFLQDNKETITDIYNKISLIPMKLRGDIVTKYPQIFNPIFTIDRGFKNSQFYKTGFNQLINAEWWKDLQDYHYGDHGKSSNFQKETPDLWYHRNLIMPFSNWKRWDNDTSNGFDDQNWFGLNENEYIYNYRDDDNTIHIGLEDKFFNPQGFLNQVWRIKNGFRLFENCGMTSVTDRVGLDLSKCVSANRMFAECYNLKSIDQELDFRYYGSKMQCKSVFLNCKNLETIEQITSLTSLTYSASDVLSPFAGCVNLKEIRFHPYEEEYSGNYYGIGSSISFGDCKNLSSESIDSILAALNKNQSSSASLKLNKEAIFSYVDKDQGDAQITLTNSNKFYDGFSQAQAPKRFSSIVIKALDSSEPFIINGYVSLSTSFVMRLPNGTPYNNFNLSIASLWSAGNNNIKIKKPDEEYWEVVDDIWKIISPLKLKGELDLLDIKYDLVNKVEYFDGLTIMLKDNDDSEQEYQIRIEGKEKNNGKITIDMWKYDFIYGSGHYGTSNYKVPITDAFDQIRKNIFYKIEEALLLYGQMQTTNGKSMTCSANINEDYNMMIDIAAGTGGSLSIKNKLPTKWNMAIVDNQN